MKTKRKISGIMAMCMAFSIIAGGCQENVNEDMTLPPVPETTTGGGP